MMARFCCILLLILLICFIGIQFEASAGSSRLTILSVSVNGKHTNCEALIVGDLFTISSNVSNKNTFKKSVIVVFKVLDSKGDSIFSDSVKTIISSKENKIISTKAQINSEGMYSISVHLADNFNSSKTISNVKSMDLQVFAIADIAQKKYLYDDFSEGSYVLNNHQLSPNGKWFGWYAGSEKYPGAQGVRAVDGGNVFYSESPSLQRQTMLRKTYSSLTLSTESFRNFHLNLDVKTISQTRTNYAPNTWEVAWIFWHAVGNRTDPVDRTHFYYFLVKTNGVEIGKYDGGTNPESQKIIQNKIYPNTTLLKEAIGKWLNWNIIVIDDRILVKINNITAFDIRDTASFDRGRIGLYNEDSRAEFRNVYIRSLC